MRSIAVAAVMTLLMGSGCSYAFSRVPDRPKTADQCPSIASPIADLVLTPIALYAGAIATWGEREVRPITLVIFFGPALFMLSSSTFGFVQYGRCRHRLPG